MSMKGKKILVTGSEGFVGKFLVNELRKKKARVIGIDIQNGTDIGNWEQVNKIEEVDIVYHLAAMMYVPFSWENPHVVYEVNVLGTLNILRYCRMHNVKKMVFASSYLYGKPEYLPIDEKHPIKLFNPYARSKKMSEDLCQGYSEDFGLNCVILRFFNIYGPGQNEKFLIPTIIHQLKNGEIELEDPAPKRDFLYVKDAIEAYINAGEYYNSDFDIFNIGSGESYSVDEIVRKIIRTSRLDVKVRYLNKRRKNEILDVIANIEKAKEKLMWKQRVGIDDGLRNVIENMNL